jgi:SAM-dependent methyltransferase
MVNSAHSDHGVLSILQHPKLYNFLQRLLYRSDSSDRFLHDAVQPFDGCNILDIGCGPGRLLLYLHHDINQYHGFDMNCTYIDYANKKWQHKPNYQFMCEKVSNTNLKHREYYDIVIANRIIHHLDDNEVNTLLETAYNALKPGGAFITYDNVYIENQSWFAKWLISKDRGNAIRTPEGYTSLIKRYFSAIETKVLHHELRVPYTIFQTRCIK